MNHIHTRRIAIFLLVACSFSWSIVAWLWASDLFRPGVAMTVGLVLAMWGPTVANLAARRFTGQGFGQLGLRPADGRGKATLGYSAVAWLLTPLLVAAGAVLFFLLNPALFTAEFPVLAGAAAKSGLPASQLATLQVLAAVMLGPLLNVVGTFGEEFGWRGYLQRELLPLGTVRALLLTGIAWGVWHFPVIALGYNYGLGYPGAPWTGMAAMLLFTVVLSIYMGWLTLRAGSIWPAVVAHGSINAVAGLGVLFINDPSRAQGLFGPTPVSLVGVSAFALLALALLPALKSRSQAATA
ncbi:MAG: CPBP family intramembrane glutamic endopeptidase [Gammaproteobacteria bacterium]|nr:CPBP family intramembrane glutamic endopeptidase [Gammaproteobacteria bacterium]